MVEYGNQSIQNMHSSIEDAGNPVDTDRAFALPVYVSVGDNPAFDLSFEEQLLHADGQSLPSLFIFYWSSPVLVLGRGQSMTDIDDGVCREEGIPILRRRTGGTAVLHNRSVSIALVLPTHHHWTRTIGGLYARFIGRVAHALTQIGIPASPLDLAASPRPSRSPICFEADCGETLILNQRKVFGCAQHRLKDAVLVHGTLLLGLDIAQQSRVFKVSEDRIERAMSYVPSGKDPRMIVDALIQSISTGLEMTPVRIGAHHDG